MKKTKNVHVKKALAGFLSLSAAAIMIPGQAQAAPTVFADSVKGTVTSAAAAAGADTGTVYVANVEEYLSVFEEQTVESNLQGRLYRGAAAYVVKSEGNWSYITSGSVSGWVCNQYLAMGEEAEVLLNTINPRVANTTAVVLNVRSEADGESDVITQVSEGTDLVVTGSTDEWWRVRLTNDTVGYISKDYADVETGLYMAVDTESEGIVADDLEQRAEEKALAEKKAAEEAAAAAEAEAKAEAEKAKEVKKSESKSESSEITASSSTKAASSKKSSSSASSSGSSSSASSSNSSSSSSSSASYDEDDYVASDDDDEPETEPVRDTDEDDEDVVVEVVEEKETKDEKKDEVEETQKPEETEPEEPDEDDMVIEEEEEVEIEETKAPKSEWESLGTFKLTAYCACSKCNGSNAGKTASGATPKVGTTIAVDRGVIPLGSKIKINGHVYTAQDTGVSGKTIDIFMGSHDECMDFGVDYAEVFIYRG